MEQQGWAISKASLRLRQLRDQARCSPQDQDSENLSLSRDLPSLGQGQRHSITTVTATIISQRIHAQCQKVMNIDKKIMCRLVLVFKIVLLDSRLCALLALPV